MLQDHTTTLPLEATFAEWAKPPGTTEQRRCENAESSIKNAIRASAKLRARRVEVFTHGSYANRTNTPGDSDVDIGVLCDESFFYDLPPGYEARSYGITPAFYGYEQFKRELGEALADYFKDGSVERGNKAFTLRENSYRVDADVTPFFQFRRHRSPFVDPVFGVALLTDDGKRIVNWPAQHYRNGTDKNQRTRESFKGVVRILKNLRQAAEEKGVALAMPIPPFLLECLTYNVPDACFGSATWTEDVLRVIAFLAQGTAAETTCVGWKEVSELKVLFSYEQKWTRPQAHAFLDFAWRVVTQ